MKPIIIFTLISFLLSASFTFAEKNIPVKSLPDSIKTAFAKSYPKAKIKACSQEMRDSINVYEVESIDNKLSRDLIYTSSGKALEIEEQVAESSLPRVLLVSIGKLYESGKIKRAEKLTKGDTVEYEVTVKVGGKTREIVADSIGKILKK